METQSLVQVKEFDPAQIALIKSHIIPGATNDELALFLQVCQRTGLDPFARQIYALKRGNKQTFQVSIDGFRAIAERTGCYAGNDDPIFDNETQPNKATVTVWKIVGGIRCAFTASARWDQYYPGKSLGFMWDKMPHVMLGKVAEALALRKGFPQQLSGLYSPDEMAQADKEANNGKPHVALPPKEVDLSNAAFDQIGTGPATIAVRDAAGKWKQELVSPKTAADLSSEHRAIYTQIMDKLFELAKDSKGDFKAIDIEDLLEITSEGRDAETNVVVKPGVRQPLSLSFTRVGRAKLSQAEFCLSNLQKLNRETAQQNLKSWRGTQ